MATARSLTLSIGAVVSILALSACSTNSASEPEARTNESFESIEIVSQPERIGDPISLDAPLDDSGALAFDAWPSACDLADITTLLAMFPQADEVVQSGADRDVKILEIGTATPRQVTIPDADCTTKVGFPVDELRAEDQSVVFLLTTSVEAAGGAEYVDLNTTNKGGEETTIGDTTCIVSASGLRYDCQMEQISFAVSLDARPYGQYFGESESNYSIDGEDVTYSDNIEEFLAMAEEKILVPLVTTDIERLSK